MRRIALILCSLAALLPASPARAATVDVSVHSNFFSPPVVHPVAGDTIRWTIQSGAHDVVAYAGTMSFASPLMTPSDSPFEQTYAGGEVLYRCTPHSFIGDGGLCSGMCGVLSDRTAPPPAPAVTSPANDSTVPEGTVLFAGSSEPWTIVRLMEGTTPLGDVLAGGDGAWSVARSMAGGTHTVAARADGADGTTGGSISLTFTVSGAPDAAPPQVVVTSGPVTAGIGRVGVFGEASDNVAVARVRVRAFDLSGALVAETIAECTFCGAQRVTWSAGFDLPTGAVTIRAVAEDLAGNVSPPSDAVLAVVI